MHVHLRYIADRYDCRYTSFYNFEKAYIGIRARKPKESATYACAPTVAGANKSKAVACKTSLAHRYT